MPTTQKILAYPCKLTWKLKKCPSGKGNTSTNRQWLGVPAVCFQEIHADSPLSNLGWLIGILTMVYYNPYITGQYNPPIYPKQPGFLSLLNWFARQISEPSMKIFITWKNSPIPNKVWAPQTSKCFRFGNAASTPLWYNWKRFSTSEQRKSTKTHPTVPKVLWFLHPVSFATNCLYNSPSMCSRIFSGVAVQILVKGQKNFISPHLVVFCGQTTGHCSIAQETVGLVGFNQWVSSWFRLGMMIFPIIIKPWHFIQWWLRLVCYHLKNQRMLTSMQSDRGEHDLTDSSYKTS